LRRPVELKQYAAGDYRGILQAAAITQSMSREANCWDNAPMESFFGTLKIELVDQGEYPDRDTARRDLFAYIEGYYRHSGATRRSAAEPPNRQRLNPRNPVSTFPGEGQSGCHTVALRPDVRTTLEMISVLNPMRAAKRYLKSSSRLSYEQPCAPF